MVSGYDAAGRVDRIARQRAGAEEDIVYGIRMTYDARGQLWRAIGDT